MQLDLHRDWRWKQSPMTSAGLLQEVTDHTCHHPLQKVISGMGSPDWNMLMADIYLWKLLWAYCSGHAAVKGNNQAHRLVEKATLTSGLLLERSEVLGSLRHCQQAQSQGHHTIDHQEERGIERESTRQSFLKGWERAIVNQTNNESISKATLGKLLRGRVERIWAFPSAHIPSLNWTELNLLSLS